MATNKSPTPATSGRLNPSRSPERMQALAAHRVRLLALGKELHELLQRHYGPVALRDSEHGGPE